MSSDSTIQPPTNLYEAIASSIDIVENQDDPFRYPPSSKICFEAIIPDSFMKDLSQLKNPPADIDGNKLHWYGADGLFLIEQLWSLIQERRKISMTFAQKYGAAWKRCQQTYSCLQIQKIHPDAVVPTSGHILDSGFDITIIRVAKEDFGPGVTLYGTGLIVKPPDGYYLDIVARSSLGKQGYFLSNCVAIIDAQYRGELFIALAKLSPEAKPLQLPARVAQAIVRPLILTDIEVVDSINQTQRGSGGFGSTGK